MKVLVIQNNSEIRDYLEFALSAFDQVELSLTGSVAKAINYLDLNNDVSCIFIGNKVNKDSDPKELLQKINTYSKTNKTNLIGTNKGLEEYLGENYIHPQSSIISINRIIKNSLGLDTNTLDLENFIPVSFELCSRLETLPCDLHFKIGKGDNAKHIKRYKKGSLIDQESLKDYQEKSLVNIYVRKEDYIFIEQLLKVKLNSLENNEKKIIGNISNAYFDSLTDSIDYGSYLIKTAGIVGFDTNKTHILAKKLKFKIGDLSSSEKNQIEDMFRLSLESKSNIDLKINSLCSILATNLIHQYTWGTKEMVEMLMYASAFHNIGLSGAAELITVVTEKEFESLTADQKNLVKNHAAYSANILASLDFIPPNVKQLIREQHGFIDGEEFIGEKKNSSNFTAMFRIISEISTEFIKEFEFNSNEFCALKVIDREKIRNNNDYPEIYNVLKDCIPKELM